MNIVSALVCTRNRPGSLLRTVRSLLASDDAQLELLVIDQTMGSPNSTAPTIRRLVPLRKHVWKELQAQANALSSLGRHVGPGQLAAVLLERSLSDREHQRGKSVAPSDAESAQKL